MAGVQHREGFQVALKAASNTPPWQPVRLDTVDNQFVAVANASQRPFGMTGDATSVQGQAAAIYEEGNYVKAVAAASLGFGAEVGIASIGIASYAFGSATTAMLGPAAGASGVTRWAVGIAAEAASGGEVFSVFVKPRQISGLA